MGEGGYLHLQQHCQKHSEKKKMEALKVWGHPLRAQLGQQRSGGCLGAVVERDQIVLQPGTSQSDTWGVI